VYRPAAIGAAEVFFKDARSGVSETRTITRLAPLNADAVTADWTAAGEATLAPDDLEREPAAPGRFDPLPPSASKAKTYAGWSKALVDALYRTETLEVLRSPGLDAWSNPGEPEREFRLRLQQAAKEARDARLDALRARFAPKKAALEDKIRRAEQAVEREAAQARTSGLGSLVRVGTTILDAVLGRKSLSKTTINKAGTAIRNVGQTMKQTGDVTRAKENLEALRQQYADLDTDFQAETSDVDRKLDPLTEALETVTLTPKKTNVSPRLVALVWTPYWVQPDGTAASAWG
jgi:hypothetical protein